MCRFVAYEWALSLCSWIKACSLRVPTILVVWRLLSRRLDWSKSFICKSLQGVHKTRVCNVLIQERPSDHVFLVSFILENFWKVGQSPSFKGIERICACSACSVLPMKIYDIIAELWWAMQDLLAFRTGMMNMPRLQSLLVGMYCYRCIPDRFLEKFIFALRGESTIHDLEVRLRGSSTAWTRYSSSPAEAN